MRLAGLLSRVSGGDQPATDISERVDQADCEAGCSFVLGTRGQEVDGLAGKRYSHDKPNEGRYSRWGYNPSSVKIGTQKVPIQVPRVMDNDTGDNVALKNFQKIGDLPE